MATLDDYIHIFLLFSFLKTFLLFSFISLWWRKMKKNCEKKKEKSTNEIACWTTRANIYIYIFFAFASFSIFYFLCSIMLNCQDGIQSSSLEEIQFAEDCIILYILVLLFLLSFSHFIVEFPSKYFNASIITDVKLPMEFLSHLREIPFKALSTDRCVYTQF